MQLLGPYVTPKTRDLPQNYEGLQLDLAEAKQIPILRWHSPNLDPTSFSDQALLQRSEVMIMELEEFKRKVITEIQRRAIRERRSEQSQGWDILSVALPYPGLRPFQREESHLFFGRSAQVENMQSRLETHRFLAVVGASGCGKSSLVRAGLFPALEQGFLSGAPPNWRIAVTQPGGAPFNNLTTALMQDTVLGFERQEADADAVLEATLRRGPLGLVEAVAESNIPEGTNFLLLVDQFEEIFRYRQQAANLDDADAFVSLLLAAAQSRPSETSIYVVITMRSDFIGDCALFTGLPEAINDSQFLIPRLTRDQYRAAIVEPARVANGELSPTLVSRLLNDLRGEPDQLPILQHALMRMWTRENINSSTRTLTLDDYNAVGGLGEALSNHCDKILNEALNPEQRRIAQVMFRAFVRSRLGST